MLYLLLGIIAVGVLVISEAGQSILKWIFYTALVGVGLFTLYWVVILAIGFLSDKSNQESINRVVIGLTGCYFMYMAVDRYKKKKWSFRGSFKTVIHELKKYPYAFGFLLVTFPAILVFWIIKMF